MSTAVLYRFFVDAFASNSEVLGFFRCVDPTLCAALPPETSRTEEFMFSAVQLAYHRGYLDAEFFRLLVQRFAARAAEVRKLAIPFVGEVAATDMLRAAERAPCSGSPAPERQPAAPQGEHVRVLFVASNPSDLDQLQLERESSLIRAQLARRQLADRVQFQVAWAVTAEVLLEQLLAYSPHIVHYAGHGNAQGEPELLGEDGTAQPASVAAVVGLFRAVAEDVRCVVFNSCYSARLAQALALEIPVVVGMRSATPDATALVFAENFYRTLAYGKSVQAAFDAATAIISLKGLMGGDLPQLNARRGVLPSSMLLLKPMVLG